jgi:hypothetical protein
MNETVRIIRAWRGVRRASVRGTSGVPGWVDLLRALVRR